MLSRQFHRFVDHSALDGSDFSLVIRVPHIDMNVRHEEQTPLLLRVDQLFAALRMTIDVPSNLRSGLCRKLGYGKANLLFPKILMPVECLMIPLTGKYKVNTAARLDGSVVLNKDINPLFKLIRLGGI